MYFENIMFSAICWLCALVFGSIALYAYKRRDPMGFWSGREVSPDEIADIPAYNRANARMWAVYAATFALADMLSLLSIGAGAALMMFVCLPGMGVLIYVYTRIYEKYRLENGTPNRNDSGKAAARASVIASVVITIIVLAMVGALLFYGERDADIVVTESSIQIKGMYGTSVLFGEITEIALLENSMAELGAGRRTNGFAGFGQALRGNFRSDTLGETLLFVQSRSAPTIKITRERGRDIYISLRDSGETRLRFAQLQAALP